MTPLENTPEMGFADHRPGVSFRKLPGGDKLPEHGRVRLSPGCAGQADRGYAPNTEIAYRSDIRIFTGWCTRRDQMALPATPEIVASFVEEIAGERKAATVKRYVSSVARLHRDAGLADPTKTPAVAAALRRLFRKKGRRQRQAFGISEKLRGEMLAAGGNRSIDARDRALLAASFDGLLRQSEAAALDIQDIEFDESDGTATVLVRSSKSDGMGDGEYVLWAADTVTLVRQWLCVLGRVSGPLFRSITKGGRIRGRLGAASIGPIYRKMAKRVQGPIGSARITSHSTRVGAAQEMAAAGLEISVIMVTGRWRSPEMVARYVARLAAKRNGTAQLAARRLGGPT